MVSASVTETGKKTYSRVSVVIEFVTINKSGKAEQRSKEINLNKSPF